MSPALVIGCRLDFHREAGGQTNVDGVPLLAHFRVGAKRLTDEILRDAAPQRIAGKVRCVPLPEGEGIER